jgi:hypothetical protein
MKLVNGRERLVEHSCSYEASRKDPFRVRRNPGTIAKGDRADDICAGGADIPPCGTVKKPGQAMDRTR